MKEILFRAKRKHDGEWIEGYYAKMKWYLNDEEVHVIFSLDAALFPHGEVAGYEEIIPETLCRLVNDPCYTDYTDERYFQGDIIELYNRRFEFNGKKTIGIVVDEHCFTENGLGRWFPQDTLQAKVIGNVWDDPELVGEQCAERFKHNHIWR